MIAGFFLRFVKSSALLSLMPCLLSLPASFAAGALTEADVVSLIRGAQIVKKEFPLRAIISDEEVVVQTRRGAKSTDKDCKIDAVFIAKSLMDAYPNSAKQVKVLFGHDLDDKFSEVVVSTRQIADFSAKRLSQQQLLDSILISSVDPLVAPNPNTEKGAKLEPGPYRERRLMLLDRIQSLKSKGTGTKPFEQLFKEGEGQIKAGDTAAADATLTTLADTLKSQELQREHLKDFHPVALSPSTHPDSSKRDGFTGIPGSGQPPEGQPGRPSGDSSLNGGPRGGPPGGVEVRPIHSPGDFEQRMRQVEDHRHSESASNQPALQSSMERVRRMLDESHLKDAEVELRRLERDLGCSSQYWNKLP